MTTEMRFIITSQHRRFAEICNKSLNSKFISLFYGKTGLGKTECALQYANWRIVEPLLDRPAMTRRPPSSIIHCTTAIFTPDVNVTPTRLQSGIRALRNRFDELVDQAASWHGFDTGPFYPHKHLKLLIIDEADRLRPGSLEVIRDLYDRGTISVLLIGSPGIERRIRRSTGAQLHSRFHLAYEMQPLSTNEMRLFIAQKWLDLQLPLSADDRVSSAIMRIANGNFRSLHRIFAEIERLQRLNRVAAITPDLIEVARQSLLLGTV